MVNTSASKLKVQGLNCLLLCPKKLILPCDAVLGGIVRGRYINLFQVNIITLTAASLITIRLRLQSSIELDIARID